MRTTRTVVAAAAAIFLIGGQSPAADSAARTGKTNKKSAGVCAVNDFSSPHFLLHTDLTAREAKELLRQLEDEQKLLAAYWGRPPSGVLECYIAKNFSAWPKDVTSQMEPDGVAKIAEGAGVCIAEILSSRNRFLAKSHLYAVAKDNLGAQVPLHEAVHGYCQQTFGRTGPRWYAEGMAEIGHYWVAGHKGVNVPEILIQYLHKAEPRSIASLIDARETTGGTWEDYCWWWFLCTTLENNPNYTSRFRILGNEVLSGKRTTFQQTFSSQMDEMTFEYNLFLKHLQNGYRVDLCAIDWTRKFNAITPAANHTVSVLIFAERGWQPSGVTVSAGLAYSYNVAGTWRTAKNATAVNADGDNSDAGKLVGMIVKDYAPGEEFDLGKSGVFTATSDGNLYLRCKLPWKQIAAASGRVIVKLRLHEKDSAAPAPLPEKTTEKTPDRS
jgi:hypothetical protein